MKSCFMVKNDVVIVYIFPRMGDKWVNYAKRFVRCYKAFKPKIDHRMIVVSNGGPPTKIMNQVFQELDITWMPFNNTGWDIGAYQHCARVVPCSIMVCFGSSIYMTRPNWLERMVEGNEKYGLALYGAMGHTGVKNAVWPHVRTTGFWFNPALLNAYPRVIGSTSQRYEFEHGRTSFAEWCKLQGVEKIVVTHDGEYKIEQWNKIPNGYHRGDQSNLLCGDRLTEPPFYPIRPKLP